MPMAKATESLKEDKPQPSVGVKTVFRVDGRKVAVHKRKSKGLLYVPGKPHCNFYPNLPSKNARSVPSSIKAPLLKPTSVPVTPVPSLRSSPPSAADLASMPLRVCSRQSCHRDIMPNSGYKMCEKCRAYGRETAKRRNEKLRQQRLAEETSLLSSDDTVMTQDQEDVPIEERLKSWISKLRKAGKLSLTPMEDGQDEYEVAEDGKRRAMDDAGTDSKRRKTESRPVCEDFQSSAHLCDALSQYMRRLQSVTSVGDFAATFTTVALEVSMTKEIVKDAADEIIVETKLPVCSNRTPVYKSKWSGGKPAARLEYRCACSDDVDAGGNLCGGAIIFETYSTYLELPTLWKMHGVKVVVKVMHV